MAILKYKNLNYKNLFSDTIAVKKRPNQFYLFMYVLESLGVSYCDNIKKKY